MSSQLKVVAVTKQDYFLLEKWGDILDSRLLRAQVWPEYTHTPVVFIWKIACLGWVTFFLHNHNVWGEEGWLKGGNLEKLAFRRANARLMLICHFGRVLSPLYVPISFKFSTFIVFYFILSYLKMLFYLIGFNLISYNSTSIYFLLFSFIFFYLVWKCYFI